MSNRFIRDLTIGNADERRARQIKGLENATEAPPVTQRPRVVGGMVEVGGGIAAGGGFVVTKEESNLRTKITFTHEFEATPIITASPVGGTNVGHNLIQINGQFFTIDLYNTANARANGWFSFRAELL